MGVPVVWPSKTPERMRTGVGLAPLGHEAGGAGPAPVERGLDVGLGQRDTRRHAVDDAADGRPVALAPGGDAEEQAEAVAGHGGARRP